jgi:sugar O-acyltransferase (sialic acid O-acetyltransferase NeuD family)
MGKVILWGTGQIAQVVLHYLEHDSEHEVAAFCMDREYVKEPEFRGRPVAAFQDIEKLYPPSEYKMAIPIGYKRLNKIREERYLAAKAKGYSFITYISSKSVCDAASVGENTFIFPCCVIGPYTTIGNNCIFWTSTCLGHHIAVEDNCFFSSPKVSGNTRIGKNSFLATNVTIGDTLEIGEYCFIGASALVTKSIPDGSVVAVKQTPVLPVKSWDMEDIL